MTLTGGARLGVMVCQSVAEATHSICRTRLTLTFRVVAWCFRFNSGDFVRHHTSHGSSLRVI
jgi:hypothetical protein